MNYLVRAFLFDFLLLIVITIHGSCSHTSSLEKELSPSVQLHVLEDTLQILCNSDADDVYFLISGGPMVKLDRVTTKQFKGKTYIPNLDETVLSYQILAMKSDSVGKMHKIDEQYSSHFGNRDLWTGPNRNDIYMPSVEVQGSLITDSLESKYLNTSRDYTLYIPKGVSYRTPIVYMLDGQNSFTVIKAIDSLIKREQIQPIVVVGVHSSLTNRYKEYVGGYSDNPHFENHERFFFEEIMKTVESRLDLVDSDRYVYGVSNGGAFAMYLGINYPNLFKEIISFSTADYVSEYSSTIQLSEKNYPFFFMGAGIFEEGIFSDNQRFADKMERNNINLVFKEFYSGHDQLVWYYEFLDYVNYKFKL